MRFAFFFFKKIVTESSKMIQGLWNDQIPDKDGVKSPINDICISPGNFN